MQNNKISLAWKTEHSVGVLGSLNHSAVNNWILTTIGCLLWKEYMLGQIEPRHNNGLFINFINIWDIKNVNHVFNWIYILNVFNLILTRCQRWGGSHILGFRVMCFRK